jgi:3-hydroxybutyryl-CoA dehydrogenase
MIEHIAVVGAGYMGGGIAQVFALAGMDVVIVDADPILTARHLDRLRQEAEDFENRGLFEPGSAFFPEGKPRVLKLRLKTRGGSECMSQ